MLVGGAAGFGGEAEGRVEADGEDGVALSLKREREKWEMLEMLEIEIEIKFEIG